MLLCPKCYKQVDGRAALFSVDRLNDIKSRHEKKHKRATRRSDARIGLRLRNQADKEDDGRSFIADPRGIVTEGHPHVILEPVEMPQLTIGDDQTACTYISYLIRRYNEFAAKELKHPAHHNHKAISQNLKSRYKSHWKDLPRVRFPHVCRYLEHRIDNTRLAKMNARKGRPSYRSYSAFLRQTRKR